MPNNLAKDLKSRDRLSRMRSPEELDELVFLVELRLVIGSLSLHNKRDRREGLRYKDDTSVRVRVLNRFPRDVEPVERTPTSERARREDGETGERSAPDMFYYLERVRDLRDERSVF